MKAIEIAVYVAVSCVMAVLFASEASAQMYRPEAFDPAPAAHPLAMGLSPRAIPSLSGHFDQDQDVFAFEVFGGGRRLDRLTVSNGIDRPGPWILYGRFYVLNFQNQLSEEPGISIGFRRTGPSLSGGARVYIGIRKRFD
jgi:hypothetical protein